MAYVSLSLHEKFETARGKIRNMLSELYSTVAATGVTNGDAHDHLGGDGATIAYTSLSGTPSPAARHFMLMGG